MNNLIKKDNIVWHDSYITRKHRNKQNYHKSLEHPSLKSYNTNPDVACAEDFSCTKFEQPRDAVSPYNKHTFSLLMF